MGGVCATLAPSPQSESSLAAQDYSYRAVQKASGARRRVGWTPEGPRRACYGSVHDSHPPKAARQNTAPCQKEV